MTGLSIPAGCLLSSSSRPSTLVALMLSKYLNMRGPILAGSVLLYTNEYSRPASKRRLLYFAGVGLPKIEEQNFLT